MRFTIDTEKKVVILDEPLKICDLSKLKKFIGKDFKDWAIEAPVHYIDRCPYNQPFGEWITNFGSSYPCEGADNTTITNGDLDDVILLFSSN